MRNRKQKLFAFVCIGVLLLLALLLLSGCGGATVTMTELKFDPDTITIKKGETVTWVNEDRRTRQIMSGVPQAMTDDFMSTPMEKGQSWSHTFDKAGEFPYHDMKITGLLGTVVVKD
ncbi:MAG: cupredoxin domain-containing protein [Thermoleophilia bacterium]